MRHRHDHHHDHAHRAGHATMRAEAGVVVDPRVHAIGRRRFLADLGRNTFAVALLGGLAACSGDDDDPAANEAATTGDVATGDAATGSATSDPAAAPTPTEPPAPANDGSPRWAQVDLGFVSAYVIVRGNEAAVVDTGDAGNTDRIGDTLATLGVNFDDVRHVVLTHSHPDHIGSLPGVLGQATTAAAYAGAADIPNIEAPVEVRPVGDGDDVFGLQVVETPGHTPGSISVYDPGIGLLFAGDALNGNDDGSAILGPDEQFTADMATANASVAKLAELDVEAAVFGHGQPVRTGAARLLRGLAAGG